MEEIWKSINGYEGIYEVSNLGNVKSLARIKFCGKNTLHGTPYKEKLLKNNVDNYGYVRVNLWSNNSCKMVKVHKLVADAFLIKNEGDVDINHINGVKTDNRLENLERCTRAYNLNHAYKTGLKIGSFKGKFGKDHHNSIKVRQLDMNGNEIKIFHGQTEASRQTNIRQADISSVCNGKRKSAGGFKWEKI